MHSMLNNKTAYLLTQANFKENCYKIPTIYVSCPLLNYNNFYRLNKCLKIRPDCLWLCHNELVIPFGLQLLWMVFPLYQ